MLVENHLQDGSHDLDGDGLLLCASHDDLAMLNVRGLHEWDKSLWHVLIHQGASCDISLPYIDYESIVKKGAYMMVFRPSFVRNG